EGRATRRRGGPPLRGDAKLAPVPRRAPTSGSGAASRSAGTTDRVGRRGVTDMGRSHWGPRADLCPALPRLLVGDRIRARYGRSRGRRHGGGGRRPPAPALRPVAGSGASKPLRAG